MISKIKLKFLKHTQRYSIEGLKKKISVLLENNGVIAMCPKATGANWKGINVSTQSMFPNQWLEIPQHYSNQVVSDEDFEVLFSFFKEKGGTGIIFNGFPTYFKTIIPLAKKKDLNVSVIFNGGLSEFVGKNQCEISLNHIIKLYREKKIDRVAIMKIGLDLCLQEIIRNKVYRVHPFVQELKVQKLKLESGKIHIGVLANGSYNKNRHNQVAGALSIENSIVHILGENEFEYLGEKDRIVSHFNLVREDFLSLLGSMDVNLYVSYSESWGQVVTESVSLGVPCLCSNNSGIFDYNQRLKKLLEIEEYDNPYKIAERIKLVLSVEDLSNDYQEYIEKTNINAQKLLNTFVE